MREKWVDGGGVGEWGWEGIWEGKKMGQNREKTKWEKFMVNSWWELCV